ncbi:MAG: response regulator [Lachnospiraceae bacterium]|nr:response regulator [Lachnospiraceae bacterium]MBR4993570.1 response regulator [Lachnospiraceae bacterium]MBR5944536.1 response regulator [Lachnospiraceae bacterium]
MYRIMLADDEGIVIDSMKFIIEKEFGDECEVEFAKTGRSVIELAERFRPDIAIMDIQMPGINGIDAMKEIKAFSSGTVFIVMSAYDKFDYAKEAIALGVLEYINKPMERTKVVQAIKKAMEIIDGDRKKRSDNLLIKEKLETVEPIIENGLIYNILFQEHFDEDIDNYKTILGVEENYGYMMSVVCGDRQEGNHMTNAVGSSVKMSNHYTEVRESLKEFFPCKVGSVMANKIAVLVPYEKPEMDYNERIELINEGREFIRYLRKKVDISFRLGIGGVKPLKKLGASYQESLSALIATTGQIAHVDDLPIGCDYEKDYPVELEKNLFDSVERGDFNEATLHAESFLQWMDEYDGNNIMAIRLKVLEFALWAERLAYQNGGMTYKFGSRDTYLPEIMSLNTIGELREWFLNKVKTSCQNIGSKRQERSTDTIEAAKEYIEKNFSKDISLDDVSRSVNISPYYFSKLFKESTGENFIEYLTNIRIEKAKELLLNSDMSMKELCSICGYPDPNYFSRTFKKNVGLTPTEYKEKCVG